MEQSEQWCTTSSQIEYSHSIDNKFASTEEASLHGSNAIDISTGTFPLDGLHQALQQGGVNNIIAYVARSWSDLKDERNFTLTKLLFYFMMTKLFQLAAQLKCYIAVGG